MRLLRNYPQLEAPLSDGRLCLSTLGELAKVLTAENVDELVERAAYLSFRKTEELVVSIRPRSVPKEGIRKLPDRASALAAAEPPPIQARPDAESNAEAACQPVLRQAQHERLIKAPSAPPLALAAPDPAPPPGRLEPVARGLWSIRVTLDEEGKEALEQFLALTSHGNWRGDLSAALREAIRCGIQVHGKRRGAATPERTRAPLEPIPRPRGERDPIPASVRREVWARDGGRCTYRDPDANRCQSRHQLEFHHRRGALVTGSKAEDLELRCKPHNRLDAFQVFGREHVERRIVERARRSQSPPGASTTDVGSEVVE